MTVTLVSPSLPGQYQGQWRMATPTGLFFGGEYNDDTNDDNNNNHFRGGLKKNL